MAIEKRTYGLLDFKIERSAKDPRIVGHAAVFNVVTDMLWYREKIAPGAFSESIATDDIRALWNHDTNIVLGRNKAGTLALREDDKGCWIDITPPDTQAARDALVLIERGDVSQMSIGFQVIKQTWVEEAGQPSDLRTLEKVKLWEVSPVTFPAYADTDVSVRSAWESWRKSIPDVQPSYNRIARLRQRLELKYK